MDAWKRSRRNLLVGIAAALPALAALPGARASARNTALAKDPAWWTLEQASREVRAGRITSVELTRRCLERIARLDPALNAFITVTAGPALRNAVDADAEIASGQWRGPVHGIPLALKDNIDTAGTLTTAASRVFAGRVPTRDAELVTRLRHAGAVLLGKLNMHEIALGTTSAISAHGPVHNPWDLQRSADGSSGGCGAAVAAALCYGAVGTDTGGSIRIPAAACGIVGLKLTYGVVSTRGTLPLSASFDHAGPLCRTVADTALLFSVLSDKPVAQRFFQHGSRPVNALRLGIVPPVPPLCDRAASVEVQAVFGEALKVLSGLVGSVGAATLRMPDLGSIIGSEADAYHAPFLAAHADAYDPRTRALLGTAPPMDNPATERALAQLRAHRGGREPAFSEFDLVVLPTLSTLPVRLADAQDPFAQEACTFAFSVGGWPAISVPCGFSAGGLPVGMLIGGPAFSEPDLLALASAYENATGWHRRRPPTG